MWSSWVSLQCLPTSLKRGAGWLAHPHSSHIMSLIGVCISGAGSLLLFHIPCNPLRPYTPPPFLVQGVCRWYPPPPSAPRTAIARWHERSTDGRGPVRSPPAGGAGRVRSHPPQGLHQLGDRVLSGRICRNHSEGPGEAASCRMGGVQWSVGRLARVVGRSVGRLDGCLNVSGGAGLLLWHVRHRGTHLLITWLTGVGIEPISGVILYGASHWWFCAFHCTTYKSLFSHRPQRCSL